MRIHPGIFAAILLGSLPFLAACGARQLAPAQLPPDVQFERGVEAYEAGHHRSAIEFFEPFVERQVGDPRVPEARFLMGRAHQERREWVAAAETFERFVRDHPQHERIGEAHFRVCESYYRLSPPPPRDQRHTRLGLAHCQAFLGPYEGTRWGEQAREFIREMRETLALKEYDVGHHYFRRRAYDAALLYFEEVLDQFPDTPVAPRALLRMVETYEVLGYEEDAAEARERLLRDYPDSPEAAEIQP